VSKLELLEAKGIDLKNKRAGTVKTTCPACSETRKDKKDPCLSVNIDEGLYNCHHCGFHGGVFEKVKREYVRPVGRLEKVDSKVLEFFEGRKISNNTLLRFGITQGKEWMPQFQTEVPCICFNYLREGELVNIKFRGAKKSFKMAKDAELIFYNIDSIKDESECIIVEGEIDALSLHESGVYNVVSVPNGASKGNQRLEYLDNCWDYFKDKKKIILMTDSDEAGLSLREELARRIGKEKCFKVNFPEGCKDANDVLLKFGTTGVKELVEIAVPYPIDGVFTMDDLFDDVVNYYENGYPTGVKIGINGLDDYLRLMPGQMTIVTGIPGSGKSEVVDYIMTQTAKESEWSWGVCSFENQPSSFHVTKIMEKYCSKSFAFRKNNESRISKSEFERGVYFIDKYFHFININHIELTLKGILEKCAELVSRKGIKGIVIDPWNYIEHKIPAGYTETQYISECLSEIKQFCLRYGVHAFIIAHPTKLRKETNGKYEVPTLYNISGSAHFFNKTDNGLSIYRDFQTNVVDIYIQKVRYSWLGKIGYCSFNFNTETRQYESI